MNNYKRLQGGYWSSFLPTLKTKAVNEALGSVYFQNEPLNRWLRTKLESGNPGLFADAVFEANFPWEHAACTTKGLVREGVLEENVGRLLADRPYAHQEKAYRTLLDTSRVNSAIISAGTGSGKTECFMAPILTDVCREANGPQYREGIRALFIYPLNALIESQQERLRRFTQDFKGKVRFVLYNSSLPDTKKKTPETFEHPEEVFDRVSMRQHPPQLMLSNPSMIERMLLRRQDRDMVQKTRAAKCFRWVVIDEAHTYVGAKAAELALLLRRLMNVFGVSPRDVHFGLTSATVDAADAKACEGLKAFLKDLSGTAESNVHLILGKRELPNAVDLAALSDRASPDAIAAEMENASADQVLERLKRSYPAMKLRNAFIAKGFMRLSEVRELLGGVSALEALKWLDLLSLPPSGKEPALLPLRLHQMINSTGPLMVCPDPQCPDRDPELIDPKWHFGQIWLDERKTCTCGTTLLPLVACGNCSNVALLCEVDGDNPPVPPGNSRDLGKLWSDFEKSGHLGDVEEGLTGSDSNGDAGASSEEDDMPDAFGGFGFEASRGLVINDADNANVEACSAFPLSPFSVVQADGEERSVFLRVGLEAMSGPGVFCCPCCGMETDRWYMRRISDRYVQFLISYILSRSSGMNDANLPMNGSRLLCFSDSRGRTASAGALLEREGERGLTVRSVYVSAQTNEKRAEAALTGMNAAGVVTSLTEIEKIVGDVPENLKETVRQALLSQRKAALAAATTKIVPWKDAREGVAQAIGQMRCSHLQSVIRSLGIKENLDFAQILLLREFGYRPVNGASIETCGLIGVAYPALESHWEPPSEWPCGGEAWKTYLTFVADYFLRANHVISMPSTWRSAGGDQRIVSRSVVRPNYEGERSKFVLAWPRVRRENPMRSQRIVRYTAALLGVNLETALPDDFEAVDRVLRRAHADLVKAQILVESQTPNASWMVLEQSAGFEVNRKAYRFPGVNALFGRVICRTPGDLTTAVCPVRPEIVGCEEVVLPSEPSEDVRNRADAEEICRSVEESDAYRALIERGAWNRLGTYALEQTGYFSAAEHSAQVDHQSRVDYVNEFNRGVLNVLSCTTTMEMGIDIAGLQTVYMAGVPPHAANYLQRAGRASRRGETRANVLTLCRSSTREQEVFARPDWALRAKQPSLTVELRSAAIVGRHVNAELLGRFCLANKIETEDLRIEDWIHREKTAEEVLPSVFARFKTWCEELKTTRDANRSETQAAIDNIVRYSALEGTTPEDELERMTAELERLTKRWEESDARFAALVAGLRGKNELALRSVTFQRDRLLKEHLYTALVEANFLPSSVRVVNVLPFVNATTREETDFYEKLYKQRSNSKEEKRLEYPSRSGLIGIHEYAPGASVLIDGLVYTSGGITLNWQMPASQEAVREIQSLRHLCRCPTCGHMFVEGMEVPVHRCPSCGTVVKEATVTLAPSGFCVADSSRPTNDIGHLHRFAKSEPYVSVDAPFADLGLASGMSMKSSASAMLLAYNTGSVDRKNGRGFAICLACGWARPESEIADDDSLLKHAPLREGLGLVEAALGGKGMRRGYCRSVSEGNGYLIQRGVVLTSQTQTDAFTLRMVVDPKKDEIASGADRLKAAATGVAVALRRAVAEHFMIEEQEIGFAIELEGGRRYVDISLFDSNTCGYCSNVEGCMPQLLEAARTVLEGCPNRCDSACSACIVSYDAQWHAKDLNRFDSLKLLSRERLNALRVTSDMQLAAGYDTTYLNRELVRWWQTSARIGELRRIVFVLHGAPEPHEAIHASDVFQTASILAHAGVEVILCAVDFAWSALGVEQRNQASVFAAVGVRFAEGVTETTPALNANRTIAFTEDASGHVRAVCTVHDVPPQGWALPRTEEAILVGRVDRMPNLATAESPVWTAVDLEEKLPESTVIRNFAPRVLTVHNFGREILAACAAGLGMSDVHELGGTDTVVEVAYTDRYLERLIDPVIVLSLMKAAADALAVTESTKYLIMTMRDVNPPANDFGIARPYGRWPNYDFRGRVFDELRQAVSEGSVFGAGKGRLVVKETDNKKAVIHGRRLSIRFASGRTLVIAFDRGVSFLTMSNSTASSVVFTVTGPGAAATTTRRLLRFLEPEGQGASALVYEREEAVLSVWWEEGEASGPTA